MSDPSSTIVATLNGNQITLTDLLKDLHLAGQLRPIIARSIVDRTIASALDTEGIEVATEEIQKASDQFRTANKLTKAEDTNRWLESRKMTLDDLEQLLRHRIGTRKLVGKVTLDKIEPFFNQNRDQFDAAQLSRIVVKSEGLANEIKSQINDDGANFADLARKFSSDQASSRTGGRTPPVPRKRLPAEIESAVFAAKEGEILGPFQVGDNRLLIRVDRIIHGQLTRRVAAEIQKRLFRQWIRGKVAEAKPEVKILELLQP